MTQLLIRPDLDRWKPGEHNGTFRGNAHAFVTAEVAIRKFWAGTQFAEVLERRSGLVRTRLEEISGSMPGSRVKGRGMMQGLDVLDEQASATIRRTCVQNGLLIEAAGPHDEVIKVMAPLTTDEATLDRGLEILGSAVSLHADDPRATPVAG